MPTGKEQVDKRGMCIDTEYYSALKRMRVGKMAQRVKALDDLS